MGRFYEYKYRKINYICKKRRENDDDDDDDDDEEYRLRWRSLQTTKSICVLREVWEAAERRYDGMFMNYSSYERVLFMPTCRCTLQNERHIFGFLALVSNISNMLYLYMLIIVVAFFFTTIENTIERERRRTQENERKRERKIRQHMTRTFILTSKTHAKTTSKTTYKKHLYKAAASKTTYLFVMLLCLSASLACVRARRTRRAIIKRLDGRLRKFGVLFFDKTRQDKPNTHLLFLSWLKINKTKLKLKTKSATLKNKQTNKHTSLTRTHTSTHTRLTL